MHSLGYSGSDAPREEDLALCTRCGMCEQACPTYRILRVEADSPRGRVFLMKQVAEGVSPINEHLAEHLYMCLGCRACETACPSGVPFGRLLEYGRHQIEERVPSLPHRGRWRLFRAIVFNAILPNRFLFWLVMLPARLLQRFPKLHRFALKFPAPARVRRLIAMIPAAPRPHYVVGPTNVGPGTGCDDPITGSVGLFTGCIMHALFRHVNTSTRRVLEQNGFEVVAPKGQWCCGALNVHAGERAQAKKMARRNIDAFARAGVHTVVVNSAGCGAVLKEYGELLRDDPDYADRAHKFAAGVQDFSEFLDGTNSATGVVGPAHAGPSTGPALRVTYQDACHLVHGQQIREQPRALIRQTPGVEFIELAHADRCCGAAGVYNLTHPQMSEEILEEKLAAIASTGCAAVVVTNPGCHMQLGAGIALRGMSVRVMHLAELLDAPGVSAASS